MPSAWALNSRQGAAAERRACAREKRTCAQEAERSERKSFRCSLFQKAATLPLTLQARSAEKKARETGALPRLSRTVAPRPLSHGCRRASSPKGGAKYVRRHKACAKPSLASPFGGGALQRRAERASCQPHRPLPWLSPLRARAPRSLVSFWLTPIRSRP